MGDLSSSEPGAPGLTLKDSNKIKTSKELFGSLQLYGGSGESGTSSTILASISGSPQELVQFLLSVMQRG